MSWVDIVWPMSGAASLTLGIIHLSIWLHRRSEWTHLAFGIAAFGVTAMSIIETLSFRAVSPEDYATLVRWAHVPFALILVSLVTYVHLRFKESRLGLAVLAAGARLVVLVPNFLTGQNLNFQSVDSLVQVTILGARLNAPIGVINPWMALGQASQLLILYYLVRVIIDTWRNASREQGRRALVVCGSVILFIIGNNTWSLLVVFEVVQSPFMVNVTFVLVILVMSYELGGEVLRAAFLSESLEGSRHQLRESERRLRLAAQSGGLGLWTWRSSIGGTWLTDNGETLLGLAPGQAVDWHAILDRVHPDDVPDMLAARKAAWKGAPYNCEFRYLRIDGSVRWLAATGRGEIGVPEEPGIILGVLQDVTVRRLAEERFRLVVENAPYATLMLDPNGRIALANARAERLLGYDRTELASLPVEELVSPEFCQLHGGLRAAFAAAPIAFSGPPGRTLAARRKDGQDVPVEVVLTPLWLENASYTLVSITDISAQLKIEQQASMQREELVHLSRIAMLGEISGSLAHELKQPLTAVLSNAQAALLFMDHDPPDWEQVRESLELIIVNDQRAGEVIRRLRAMMSKDPVEHQGMDVNETVRETLHLLNSDLINRGVTPSLVATPDLPVVIGDAVQIKQVLINLIVNACDAMREDGKARLLALSTFAHADGSVEIAVSDSGSGIPESDMESIFTPFVTTKAEGMGLGLAICHTIIQAHGGRLWASNNDLGGATFHLLLPTEDQFDE